MRILLSNDDGIDAPGLAALRAGIDDLGEVTVAAPDSPQSAAGHGITVIHPLTVQRVTVSAVKPFAGLSISGRPADCVRLAIRKLLPEPPELVVSGINAGANVGINVFYSGTVAAAAEAAMMGIPAVAFSASVESGTVDFPSAAGLCRSILDWLLETGLARGELLNVNIPDLGKGRPVGVRVVRQSTAELQDYYHEHLDDSGAEMYRMSGGYSFSPEQETTDVVSLAEGYITVTPLHVDMTNHARLARLERLAVPDVS